MGIPVRRKETDVLHLDHKEHVCLPSLLHRSGQLFYMLYRPVAWRIRETYPAVLFQGHTLDLDQDFLPVCFHIQVKP